MTNGVTSPKGMLVPKRFQLQPQIPERPPKHVHPDQIPLWKAPATNSLSDLIVSVTSGSSMAHGQDADTLYALCTLARHAVERYPSPSDDVQLIKPTFAPDGEQLVVAGGIVVASLAAAHAVIGRANSAAGRGFTDASLDRLAHSGPMDEDLVIPLIGVRSKPGQMVKPRSKVEKSLRRLLDVSGFDITAPKNQHKDPYWFVFEPSTYLWEHILEGEQGWWVSAGAYRKLSEGRRLWLWLKGQTQAEAIRKGGPIEIRLRLLHDKLGLHSRDASVARRSLQRAAEDIYENVPGFLRGLPVFGIGGRGFAGKVRFQLDPGSEHIASAQGRNRRLLAEADTRRQAIDAGLVEVHADDIVRLMLSVKGIGWDDIEPLVQLHHAKLLIADKPDITLAEIEPHMRWHQDDDYWFVRWDIATVRRRWYAIFPLVRDAAA